MKTTTLIATLTSPPSADGEELRELYPDVGVLEVRGDLLPEVDVARLREQFSNEHGAGDLLFTLRSRAEGGASDASAVSRAHRLAEAAELYDLVDLEADRDLEPELLAAVPPSKRVLSWHGPRDARTTLADLEAKLDAMLQTEARIYKLIPFARNADDGLAPLQLLARRGREDVTAFCAGDAGAWTRPLAPRLGAPWIYGALGDVPGAPGQLTIERLRRDFDLPRLPEVEALYGIVGNPVLHSLSPHLHNGAYRALGIPAIYVPFHVESFSDFWLDLVESGVLESLGLPLRGLSVTAPHKDLALSVSGVSSPRAQHIGASNTLMLDDEGVWEAESTDPEGVIRTFAAVGVDLPGAKAAVVGCGGAGKAAAYGLEIAGADVTLVNRGRERGERAARELGMPFQLLADFNPGAWDVIVQATALGHRADDPLPFDVEAVRRDAVVVDLVYGREPTRLVRELRGRGVRAEDGLPVLLYQALAQFRCLTGRELPESLAREILEFGSPVRQRNAKERSS